MLAAKEPLLEVQKNYWKEWNTRSEYPHDRALRRGDKILALLRSLRCERPVLLDLGCGMGWFANQLAELGPTLGIDLSDEAIERAKAEFPRVEFRAGNVFEMDLPARHFDVIVSQEVIAHVPDQSGYLALAARVLKPGGHLILTTPNRFVHDRVAWPPRGPGHIESWLDKNELYRLLRLHFRVLRRTTAFPLGDQGILRLVNSPKLNRALGLVLSADRLTALKEWAGFGWTQIVLAAKKS